MKAYYGNDLKMWIFPAAVGAPSPARMAPATKAYLGNNMKAYYDNDQQMWIFPGDDRSEWAKAVIGAPSLVMSATKAYFTIAVDWAFPAKNPYYDNALKIWVFPGDKDPKPPIGPRQQYRTYRSRPLRRYW